MATLDFAGLSVLKFQAKWCEPCKRLHGIISKMEKEFPEVKIYNIDIDEETDLAKRFNVKSLPTLVFMTDNREKIRIEGMSKTDFVRKAFKTISGRKEEDNDKQS